MSVDGGADQPDHIVRPAVYVGRGEAQDPVAGLLERVLPPVVADEAISMVPTVELDDQVRLPVVEIGAADKLARAVIEVRLDFRNWAASIRSQRRRVSMGDSAGAASSASCLNREAPARPFTAAA